MLAATMLTAASCSDFDDYNETPVVSQPAAGQSLWENISQNAELSDFCKLVERTGFQTYLQQPRAYTVWAPRNGFDFEKFDSIKRDSLLLAQFVKNHIAEYNYVASGDLQEKRIRMLNGKSFTFSGNGTYAFNGIQVSTPNLPNQNGVLHILDDYVKFYPNLSEFLHNDTAGIGKLASYVLHYENRTIDYDNMEKSSIDSTGKQEYVDTVYVVTNSIFGRGGLNAKIDNEDSTYTFVMPTNKAYQEYYDRIKPYYNFILKTQAHDPANYDKSSDGKVVSTEFSDDSYVAYYRDSLVKQMVARDLIYSKGYSYNAGIWDPTIKMDTIYTSHKNKLSNPNEILNSKLVGDPVEMSNGYARIVDTLAFYPWETYNPEIVVPFSRYMIRAFNHNATGVRYTDPYGSVFGPEVTSFTYTLIEPKVAATSKPEMFVRLPDVLSGKYRIYCVFLPYTCGKTGVNLPTAMNFQLRYTDAANKLQTYNFCADPADPAHKANTTGAWTDNPKTLNLNTAFVNDTAARHEIIYNDRPYLINCADTICLGEFTFPICYKGLDNNSVAPSIYISSPLNVFNKTQMAQYSREFRFWAFILRPVEYDEYLKKQNKTNNDE